MQTLKGQFFFQDKAPLVWTRPAKEKTVIQDITNVYIGTSLWVKMLQVKSVFRFDRIFFVFLFEFNNGQKCLGHICSLGALFKSHMPKNKVDACSVSRIFPEFRLCIGWVRENCNIFSKRFYCLIRAPKNYKKS